MGGGGGGGSPVHRLMLFDVKSHMFVINKSVKTFF